jgi:mono/diheme cytochrome c family protein
MYRYGRSEQPRAASARGDLRGRHVTGPNDDDDAESQDEATLSETLVDGEAGQAHVEKGGMAPTGPTLTRPEFEDIEAQYLANTLANQGRAVPVPLDEGSVN